MSQLTLALGPPRPSVLQTSKCATCRRKFRWVSGCLCRGPCDQPVCDACAFGESLAWCRTCLIDAQEAQPRRPPFAQVGATMVDLCRLGGRRAAASGHGRGARGCRPLRRARHARHVFAPHLESSGLGNEAGFTTPTDSLRSGQADPLWHKEGTVQGPATGAFAGTHAYVLWDGDDEPVIVGYRALCATGRSRGM